jgi:hypothetical protein
MSRVIGIDSSHEPVTAVITKHRTKNVYPHFRSQGFKVQRFKGARARRDLVSAAASKTDVVYLTGVGHGLYDTYQGDQFLPVFEVGKYGPAEVNAKIVHLLSCLTALGLGPDFVTNGTRAFFGYDENFTFLTENHSPFLDCDAEIDKAFAEGLTAAGAFRRAYDAFNAAIAAALQTGNAYVAAVLEFNRDHLCAPSTDPRYGQVNARLSSPKA